MELKKANAPIPRMGGKSILARRIVPLFPTKIKTYIEPFFGAGNVFFKMMDTIHPCSSYLNDLDNDIYVIMIGLRDENINEKIDRNPMTKDEYKTKFKQNEFKAAHELIVKYKRSFFGKGRSYSSLGSGSHIIKTDFDVFKNKLKDAVITNLSFEKVIQQHCDDPDAFFYLDPPYSLTSGKSGYYSYNAVTPDDIFKCVQTIKGKWILSYDDTPKVKELFSMYHIYPIHTIYSANGQKVKSRVVKELIIANYELELSPL